MRGALSALRCSQRCRSRPSGVSMSDWLDDYRTHAHKLLRSRGNRRLASSEAESAVAEVVLFPSFHPEVILQASKAATTSLRLTSLTESLWSWYSSDVSVDAQSPQKVTETVALEQGVGDTFWRDAEELQPLVTNDRDEVGLDGMTIDASYCTASRAHSFSTWSPSKDSQQHQYVLLLYRLAWESLAEQTSIESLEQLHVYLDLGLPARVIEESPRRIRIFGSLGSDNEKELNHCFWGFPRDEPLVVDMTNFDRMGTGLYPSFLEFANTHSRVAWVGSPSAVTQLQELGIQAGAVCGSIEAARRQVLQQ